MPFAQVALPLPIRQTFTYRVPEALAARLGMTALAAPGCSSCGSCGAAAKASSRAATQVITVHLRTRR